MLTNNLKLRIAIIHEWFITYAGSERVIEQILQVFPEADLFCLMDVLSDNERGFLRGKKPKTSFLQSFPFKKKLYRHYLPFMPVAVEQFDLSQYDVVISNCHAVSKGAITNPNQLHLSYIHSPLRYAWDMQNEYFPTNGPRRIINSIARVTAHYIRMWDVAASSRPDVILASSSFIAQRIKKYYRRESSIFYPPVDVDFFSYSEKKEDYYLAASRLVPYKRMDLIVDAFCSMPDKKLIVIGDGPEREKIKRINAANIQWFGYQDANALRDYMQNARAFIFAAKEDFGIAPLEAQACGTPVIAFGQGGVKETICGLDMPQPTGVFFREQTAAAICDAVNKFESDLDRIRPTDCRENAKRFSNERFQREFKEIFEEAWREFSRGK